MPLTDPGRAVGSKAFSIDKQGGLPVRRKIQHDPLSLRPLGKNHAPLKPAVFPSVPPDKSGLNGNERKLLRLLRTQMLHGAGCPPGYFTQRLIKILLQCSDPMVNAVPPLRIHDFHAMTSFCTNRFNMPFSSFSSCCSFFIFGIDFLEKKYIILFVAQEWRNWQTRTVQVRVVAIP